MGMKETIAVNRSGLDKLIAKLESWQDELDDVAGSRYWADRRRATRLRCQIRAARDNLRLAAIVERVAADLGWVDPAQDDVEDKLGEVVK